MLEIYMGAKKWSELSYEHVPSIIMINYVGHFVKHDNDRYVKYLKNVTFGKKKVSADVLLPHMVAEEAVQGKGKPQGILAEAQWKRMIMAPKRDNKKRKPIVSPYSSHQVSMKLRSGCLPNKAIDQEASSRIQPLETPLKKKGRILRRCVFIDDEAHVEEDSNNIEENIEITDLLDHNEDESDGSDQEQEGGAKEKKHSRHLGKKISLGLMKDVLSQFYVKKRTLPPPVTLCRFVVHEVVRGDTMLKTAVDLEEWGPLRREQNAEFERALGREWQELKGNKLLVWDEYSDNPQYHVSVRCQFLEVTKAKEAELLLALDTSNAISRAHVTPNIAHEMYMFQKFGLANKESILETLTPHTREWAKVEMTVEARYYHGLAPWYNTPCGLISQLVWKDKFNAYMSKEATKLDALGLNDVGKKKRLDKATKVEEERLKDRGYKYLSIANPLNGDEFLKLLYGIKWNDPGMLKITRDKL
ncbi:hypothetical protein L7F22_020873 [Adiantum nelumboides]|nr:hypothetical protein [Adiantum nelumboides]